MDFAQILLDFKAEVASTLGKRLGNGKKLFCIIHLYKRSNGSR